MVTLGKLDVDPSKVHTVLISSSPWPRPATDELNYLRVSKNGGAIEGQYFIDVSIPLMPQLVSDTVSGAENLSLYTKNGTVTADLWVTGNSRSKRVSMKLRSDNGHLYAKIVCLSTMSSLRATPALPSTSIFGPHMEISPFHCPAVFAGQ